MLTSTHWQTLLAALDPDPTRAALVYEQLRHRLIRIYASRAASNAEDLADRAFDRVARQLSDGVQIRTTVAAYVTGVARRIAWEIRRTPPMCPLDRDPPAPEPADDHLLSTLERCLAHLPPDTSDALLRYSADRGIARINHRKALAAELDIPLNALRIRMHRLRTRLLAMMTAASCGASYR